MRRVKVLLLACVGAVLALWGATPREQHADRAFRAGEWAQAQAMYTVMTASADTVAALPYARAIVAAAMMADTTAVEAMAVRAMTDAVPLDSLLANVRRDSYDAHSPAIYPMLLKLMGNSMPYLHRPMLVRRLAYCEDMADAEGAIACCRELLEGMPEDIDVLWSLAKASFATGDVTAALQACNSILNVNPDNMTALLALANYYDGAGNAAEALAFFQRAAAISSTPYVDARIRALSSAK